LYDKDNNESRVVTAITDTDNVVINTAFSSSSITNVLTSQDNQNKEHSHTTNTISKTTISGGAHSHSLTQGRDYNAWSESNGFGQGRFKSAATSSGGPYWTLYTNSSEHSHNIEHTHNTTSNGGNEARPENYTIKVWVRTA
jgi:hypothetical protein